MDKCIVQTMDKEYIAPTYGRFDLVIESGNGAACVDSEGREYIDFTSGIGVNTLGYSNAGWASAVAKQAATLSHTSNLYYTAPCTEVAQQFCRASGMSKMFFANSGAEANEGAIKTARKCSFDRYGKERYRIITLKNSFHGRTVTTLAATGQDSFHNSFMPFTEGFVYTDANDCAALTAAVDKGTCAIMLEFIQGEGGVQPLEQQFVDCAVQLCKQHDMLLIADEVQTGIGRTGKLFCGQHYGVKADIITVAKGLGGGLPIGGFLLNERTESTLGAGDHGSTFGGNPIACAGAKYILEQLTDSFLDTVTAKGDYIRKALAGVMGISGITGSGLMLGLAVAPQSARQLAERCLNAGLLVLTAKDKLRLLPPLNITYPQLDSGIAILKSVIGNYNL